MLEYLHLKNVGPASEMKMDLAPRLNLITGDNGLGKSFLLDVAWWALTRTWAREMAVPRMVRAKARVGSLGLIRPTGEIGYAYTKRTRGPYEYTSTYDPAKVRWTVKHSRPPIPGLILYAQVDGGFSVWDPMQNYWTEDAPDRPNAFLFSSTELWKGNQHCNGLIEDWALWQNGNEKPFQTLKDILKTLSPSPTESLEPGQLRRVTTTDPKRYPTLRMPYGEDVPVIHVSAGMQRVIALAYLITWAWQRHLENAELRGESPTREIIFLIDEIEGHLHPQWQRRVIPAVLKVMDTLTGHHGSKVQLLTATHSPLVLASVEPTFDAAMDAWFDLDLENQHVVLRKRPYIRRGEIGNWLVSEAFDLKEPRSLEGEQAIAAAQAVLDAAKPSADAIAAADRGLRNAGLPDIDPFWVAWGYFKQQHAMSPRRLTLRRAAKGKLKA